MGQILFKYSVNVTALSSSVAISVPNPNNLTTTNAQVRVVRVTATLRGDTAALYTGITMNTSGDATAANYRSLTRYALGTNAWDTNPGTAGTALPNVGYMPAASSSSTTVFNALEVVVSGWDQPHSGALTWIAHSGFTDSVVTNMMVSQSTGVWLGTAAPGSLVFTPASGNFAIGSAFYVEGLG